MKTKTKPRAACVHHGVQRQPRREHARQCIEESMLHTLYQRTMRRSTKFARFQKMGRVITEQRAMGEEYVMKGNNFAGVHRQLIIDGTATDESLKLLYGWMGNVSTVMCMRYARGNKTMRLGIKLMMRGRRALNAAYRRSKRLGKIGFAGPELLDFEDAFDLAVAITPSFSKSELREAFKIADERSAKLKQRIEKVKAL